MSGGVINTCICGRLIIWGQTCTCGHNLSKPTPTEKDNE